MKIKLLLMTLLAVSCTLFVSCEHTGSETGADVEQLAPTQDAELNKLLSEYPSEITVDNFKEFINAPNAVLDHFSAKEGRIAKPAVSPVIIDDRTKEEIMRVWKNEDQESSNRMPCNCAFITAIVPNTSYYPTNWEGGMFADLNFSGGISTFDLVIMARIINNYDNNNDNAITGWGETLGGTAATYDYDGNGVIDNDDNWAAAMFTWQLSDISPSNSSFDFSDITCVQQYILGIFTC